MQPLIPPPPPATLGQALHPPLPPSPSIQSPVSPEENPHVHDYLPRPLGDETIDAIKKFNPYKLTIFERCYLGLIVVGALVWIAQLSLRANFFVALLSVILIYVAFMIWGALFGRLSWSLIAKWSVKGWLLNVWKSRLFPIFSSDACMIRVDSFVIENKPSGLWNNIIFSIKQSWTSSLLLFTILFWLMPDDITELSSFSTSSLFLLLFAPVLSSVLVPLYIFSDSSVVEVIPGKRDFAPVGMSLRQALSRFIGYGSIVIVFFTVLDIAKSSSFIEAVRFLTGETLMLLSVLGATVLAAALSYPNKLHIKWVEEFNKLWFEGKDPDHTFHRIDDNAYIVMPDHLLHETLTHLREYMGTRFAEQQIPLDEMPHQHSPTITQYSPPPPGLATAPPPPSTISSQGAPPPPN
jgi:hypothetical protein